MLPETNGIAIADYMKSHNDAANNWEEKIIQKDCNTNKNELHESKYHTANSIRAIRFHSRHSC